MIVRTLFERELEVARSFSVSAGIGIRTSGTLTPLLLLTLPPTSTTAAILSFSTAATRSAPCRRRSAAVRPS
jgi:hypothetical protein